jgi:hypothetical protein
VAINFEKAKEQVEKSFVVRLEKESNDPKGNYDGSDLECEVEFAVDISGSMNSSFMSGKLYSNGTVGEILSRFYVVANMLDKDKKMGCTPFSEEAERLKVEVTASNYADYVKNEIMNKNKGWYFYGTNYSPMIDAVVEKGKVPKLVICIVDGDAHDKTKAKKKIIESADTPTFFLFIGIGKQERFEFLEMLDDIPDSQRTIDNVDFKQIVDVTKLSDKELYDMIADEFVGWFYKAKSKGIF